MCPLLYIGGGGRSTYMALIIMKFAFFYYYQTYEEKLGNTKVIFRRRKSWKDRQYNGQRKKDKHRSTKCYTEIGFFKQIDEE